MKNTKKLIQALGLIFLTSIFISCGGNSAKKTAYPAKPLTYIVPWAAGGMTDMSSRMMAVTLQKHLGQSVNVVNRTGGGGVVGHLALSQAKPDGYTIGAVTGEITQLHHMGLTDLTYLKYAPLALILYNPAAITVRIDAPWNTVDELIEAIKKEPGNLQASGTARGGIWDIARSGFLNAVGLSNNAVPWVPSQGASPALQELIAGGVDIVTASLAEVDPLRKAGQVKTLAVMSEERLAYFPDVPTLKEQGIDWSIGGWVSLCAPAGLPFEIKATLDSAIYKASMDADFIKNMTKAGSSLHYMAGEEFSNFLKTQDESNGILMKQAGLTN
ncbi:MAG: tripartite-type tricarboxylate transporter receptor subunit TctC [Saprospiraceae bacterium]|jgi:tripartite-type tricarboxylate transporter receptor subunit TctC